MKLFFTRRLAEKGFAVTYARIAVSLLLENVDYVTYALTVTGYYTQLFTGAWYREAWIP